MRITFCGVRGSCPSSSPQQRRYGGNTSSILVEVPGEPVLLLDLGTGVRDVGRRLDEERSAPSDPLVVNVLLTHVHYDHILGLPFFAPLRDPNALVTVYGPAQEATTLHEVLAGAVRPPYFPIHLDEFEGKLDVVDLVAPTEIDLGSISVTARTVSHRGETLGYRIGWGGRSVAYLPDHQEPTNRTEIASGVLELCAGADLVIHDAQYNGDEFSVRETWGHSTVEYAVRVAGEAGARSLALFHHDPAHTDEEVDQLLGCARDLAAQYRLGDVTAAWEGLTVEFDPERA